MLFMQASGSFDLVPVRGLHLPPQPNGSGHHSRFEAVEAVESIEVRRARRCNLDLLKVRLRLCQEVTSWLTHSQFWDFSPEYQIVRGPRVPSGMVYALSGWRGNISSLAFSLASHER